MTEGATAVPADDLDSDLVKARFGWMMYDWARSAFETSVVVAVLPAWFSYLFIAANGQELQVGPFEFGPTSMFALVTGVAALIVAVLSPGMGVIADRRPIKQSMLRWMTILGAGATILLGGALLIGVNGRWIWLAVMFLFANIGANAAGVFYNALLPHLGTSESDLAMVLTKAFSYGYLGGGLLLAVHLGLVVSTGYADWATAFALSSSGIWWLGFAMYTFAYVPEPEVLQELEDPTFMGATKEAVREVRSTVKEFFGKFKILGLYLLAYLLFTDGIQSVTSLSGAYGADVLGVSLFENMIVIMLVQFVAWPSALFFIRFARWTTAKTTLTVTLSLWIVVILAAISFAPLELEEHGDHEFQATWDGSRYLLTNASGVELGSNPSGSDMALRAEIGDLLPPETFDAGTETYEFTGEPRNLTGEQMSELIGHIEQTRFALSIANGTLMGSYTGIDHPTDLGDGVLDAIPITVRDRVWAPLGLEIGVQWLLIGLGAGFLLGGSQGIARSLFAQMIPEHRSAEFFGFIGFFGKIATLTGPWIYVAVDQISDPRTAIFSILSLVVMGLILLQFVDVEAATQLAEEENRSA